MSLDPISAALDLGPGGWPGQDRAETTNIWSGLAGTCAVLIMSPFFFTPPVRWHHWALFLSMGFIGGSAHYRLTRAWERGAAARPAPHHGSTSISSKTQIAAFCQCSPACSDA